MGVIHRTIHGIRHGYREAILCYQVDTRSCISFKHNKTHTNIFCSDKNGTKVLVKEKVCHGVGKRTLFPNMLQELKICLPLPYVKKIYFFSQLLFDFGGDLNRCRATIFINNLLILQGTAVFRIFANNRF